MWCTYCRLYIAMVWDFWIYNEWWRIVYMQNYWHEMCFQIFWRVIRMRVGVILPGTRSKSYIKPDFLLFPINTFLFISKSTPPLQILIPLRAMSHLALEPKKIQIFFSSLSYPSIFCSEFLVWKVNKKINREKREEIQHHRYHLKQQLPETSPKPPPSSKKGIKKGIESPIPPRHRLCHHLHRRTTSPSTSPPSLSSSIFD